MKHLSLFVILIFALIASPFSLAQTVLHLGTTTTVRDSGLLDEIQAGFHAAHGIVLRTLVMGSGQVLKAAQRGDIDIALTHAPEAEKSFIENGFGLRRSPVFFNHFLLVGPATNPTKLKGDGSIETAYKDINRAGLAFVSRDDFSGTHAQEIKLRKKLGIQAEGRKYIKSGRGMGPTLQLADQLQAYTLTDFGTWHNFKSKLSLKELAGNDQTLINQYSLIALNPSGIPHPPPPSAEIFYRWLTSPEAQALIDNFRVDSQQLFHSGSAGKEI